MRSTKSLGAIAMIVLGALFIILKGSVISIAMTLVGVVLILFGIQDVSKHIANAGAAKIVAGVCVILFGWVLVSLACYVLAVILIVHGIIQLREISHSMHRRLAWIRPAASVIAGLCLLFNHGGTIDWVFLVAGILLIIDGALQLAD